MNLDFASVWETVDLVPENDALICGRRSFLERL